MFENKNFNFENKTTFIYRLLKLNIKLLMANRI